ncbi:DNA mismatch repair protein [Mucilaginibacter sp. RS28]|uniref:DNA mismatch repair protein n=1 Tax=Mucilaginibacter straminoryzae TaxID=2932774 RepID=A0A9X2B7W7_9SPHI|nr:DNA mismatch repair protein [Mucilaginibacter straminoryzae]MCJ8208831.1 DNA mismatch repair protein [Mucilaginibacter straminoryzae]
MSFSTDKQTLDDLKIFGRPGGSSIFNLFNSTRTRGGADILEQMFLQPLDDAEEINARSLVMQLFTDKGTIFPFQTEHLDNAEMYLAMTDERTMLSKQDDNLSRKFSQLISADGDYKTIHNGVVAIIDIIRTASAFIGQIKSSKELSLAISDWQDIINLLADEEILNIRNSLTGAKLAYEQVADTDKVLRFQYRNKIKQLLAFIYRIDVFISVAEVAKKNGYVFPLALAKGLNTISLTDVRHPLVNGAIANSIDITPQSNVIFLTGVNMAGKSTFMKSLGVAIYLAHMGFPVAASKMQFSVRDGLFTTINLPDDLGSGNSHFYAEVLRVKKVAKELSTGKNLFIIFDELFRGTNVKDAFEGTVAITQAFAEKANCMFLVSTHIIEAGDILKEKCSNINFVYLPTRMNKNTPVYTYKLEQGITADRHGMIIINNERILEIIRSRKNKTT